MASWKKVLVSGSAAELSSLTLDTALPVAQGGTNATSLADKSVLITQDSGTDTVSALALTSNGSIIVGGTGGPAVEAAADVAGTGLTAVVGDGTLVINVDAAQTQITDVGALDAGSITSGFGNIDNGTSTLNTGNATVDNLVNDSSVANSRITGSFTGSFVGDGTGLTGTGLDIDSLSALGGTGLHQTQDHFVFSDNGTEKKITFSNLEDAIFGNVSGDASIAAGGALTIAGTSVENSMLVNDGITIAGVDTSLGGSITSATILNGTSVVSSSTQIDNLGFLKVSGDSVVSSSTQIADVTLTTAAQTNITSLGTLTTLTVDDITINGSTISDGADFTLDVEGDITLDANGADIILSDNGTDFGRFKRDSSDFIIKSEANNNDIVFRGQDGGATITALTLDMSEAGKANLLET